MSPFDCCFEGLSKALDTENCEWGRPLLKNYIEKIKDQMDRKYQTYKWNFEVQMQKEVVKNKAIRQCLSDSTKADAFNLTHNSSGDKEN